MDESLIAAESCCSSVEQFPFTSWLHLSLAWGRLSIFVPAVLAAGAPDEAAFMSDEAMESVPGLKPIQYTAKHYTLYLDKMVEKAKKLNRGNTGSSDGSICILTAFVNVHTILMAGFEKKLPFFSSGSSAGLDAPQAGAVFVGHGCNRTAAAPTSGACEGWHRHWPGASKKDQNQINISTAHYFLKLISYWYFLYIVYICTNECKT